MDTGSEITATKPGQLSESAFSDTRTAPLCSHESLAAGVDYDPATNTGAIILNITCIAREATDSALRIVQSVLASPYAFSNRFVLAGAGSTLGGFSVPEDVTAIGTVCSMTLNGLLLSCGVHAQPKYGGIVKVKRFLPEKFSAFLSSGNSLLTPLDDFLSEAMTSVCTALHTGTGEVLGSFLEIPGAVLGSAKRVYSQLKQNGMGGKIMFGMISEPLLSMPVSIGSAGMVVFRDINTVAALAEQGIKPQSPEVKTLFRFEQMQTAAR